MGLLLTDTSEDLSALKRLFQAFAQSSESTFRHWGFGIDFVESSLAGISEIASHNLFDGTRFPTEPGAFKRAAAVCLCTRMFVDVKFRAIGDPKAFEKMYTEEELDAWIARIAFMLIPMVIARSVFTLQDGKQIQPSKCWQPASFHVRLELLGFLRWLETPVDAAGALDADRLAKAILALALIIEQSYYLVDAELHCDVHDQARCYDEDDSICSCDAFFLNPEDSKPYPT